MDNAAIVELLKWLVGIFGASFLTWVISRRKERADITNLITEAAGEIVENLRADVKDLREQVLEQKTEIGEVKNESKELLVILREWASGIQELINQIKRHDDVPCWSPNPEHLKKVE